VAKQVPASPNKESEKKDRANSVFLTWLFSRAPHEERTTDPVEVLYRSVHVTAKCRYNASIRLKRVGSFSFLTATVLSLGLILIPMLQLSGMRLAYPDRILSSLQVFFAVAVLIYSVINGTAHYATRAQSLNEVGDRIKELSRTLRTDYSTAKARGTRFDLKPINQRYTRISTASENHSRSDYGRAVLQCTDLYKITGLPRLWLEIKVALGHFVAYIIPLALILIEIAILLDILGATKVFKPFASQ
jgi:SMODS and SLOG-associating 2TM effector domain family 5